MSALFRVQLVFSALAVALASDAASQVGSHSGSQSSAAAEYRAHRQQFHGLANKFRGIANDSVSFETRLGYYQRRKAEVEAHNARPDKTWVATVDNMFADFTDGEWGALLGYRRHAGWVPAGASGGPKVGSFLEIRGSSSARIDQAFIKESVNWMDTLNTAGPGYAVQQGGCGSCWAVAAAGAIETQVEKVRNASKGLLSVDDLVHCTPNERECGGSGGCGGATVELAFNTVLTRGGLVAAKDYTRGYKHGGGGKCDPIADSVPRVNIESFFRLPSNNLLAFMNAVITIGPLAISLDGSPFGAYSSGTFDGCNRDASVNHAVLLVGYGVDANGVKYFTIRNSWGSSWGEGGYMRMKRFDSDRGEAGWCGTDYAPLEGVGCRGGPKTLPVCGMCGMLSDTAYVVIAGVAEPVVGLMER